MNYHFTILTNKPKQHEDDPDEIEEVDGYLTVGFFENGKVAEIFLKMGKPGSAYSGFTDCFSITFSLLLQHGVPLADLIRRFRGMQFEPSGRVKGRPFNELARSPVDYVCRYLEKFV